MSPQSYPRPSICSTATTTWVTSCRTKYYDCTSVSTATSVCAEGLICLTDAEGRHLCNFAYNWPPVNGGQYVTVVLAGILVVLFGAVAVFWVLDRRRRSRRARDRRAAAAKDAGSVRTPLLHEAPPPPVREGSVAAPASWPLEMR